jgi:hypothetical protein
MLIGSFAFSKAQVVLNEVYTDPGAGKSEFFELYNTSVGNIPINLDCYYLVVMYATGSGQLSKLERGFFVIEFPNVSINAKQYLVGAAADPFNVQAKTNVDAAFSWNDLAATSGSITKYTYNGVGYDNTTASITGNLNDYVFTSMPSSMGVSYAFFLFDNGSYINGFVGGGGVSTSNVPTSITGLPSLNITTTCGAKTLNFSQLTKAEFSNSAPGSDNGYARVNDGACGTWNKTANNHTPGTTNGTAVGLSGSLTTTTNYNCSTNKIDPSYVTVQILGATGDANADNTLPVDVQLYYDNTQAGVLGELDGSDVIKGTIQIPAFSTTVYSFTIPAVDRGQPVLVVYKTVLGCFDQIQAREPSCIALPVKFSSFTATRSTTSSVSVTWTTASEQNSKGFYVQKNVNGVWTNVAYVPSQAANGSSTSSLTYSYTDMNSDKGITQYRVQQVDLDGKFAYTDIRAIRGEGTVGKVVLYPNPSSDGKVNIVFEDNTAIRDVIVNDMQGKVVRSFRGISNNILVIEKLTTGFYTIKVTNRITNASSVHKVVIK